MTVDKKSSKILIVDDNPVNIDFLVELLKDYDARTVLDGLSALEAVDEERPDVILLDITMPMMDGYEVCRRLKASSKTKDIPIIFLTAHNDSESIVKAFEVGGVDYITKPYNTQEVLVRLQTQLKLTKALKTLEYNTYFDELTGVPNRKKFFRDSKKWIKASQAGIPFYLFTLTIANFRDINDIYGYEVGDKLIKAISLIIKKVVKVDYSLSRFGGTEFFLVFIGITESEAIKWAESIKEASKKVRFKGLEDLDFSINTCFTASQPSDTSINGVIKRAHESCRKV